jgi:epoxyqueuosine reductase
MSQAENKSLSLLIKDKARELGFDMCGIAKARNLAEREPVMREWLNAGMNDKMEYLGRNLEKRLNPELLFPGARSLVVTGLNYYSGKGQKKANAPILSRYAYGMNYHDVIIPKLDKLLLFIKGINPGTEGKALCDSAPLLEKAWAVESGLGWQGRHSIVINKEAGSFFFIGILILGIKLDYDKPFTGEYCGDCRICLESCPTAAINGNRTIDARKCIANLTIENRGPIPGEFIPLLERRIYGCDKCQEVCPWNKKAKPDTTPEFTIDEEVAEMSLEEWQSLSRERFDWLFKNSSVGRVKYEQFTRNITDVTGS